MIEQLIYMSPYLSAMVAVFTTPSAIKWLIRKSRMSDDRAVCAHLHAVGPSTRGGLVGSVGGLSKGCIERALVRLCASGMVDRDTRGEDTPFFSISEGAEVLIDE